MLNLQKISAITLDLDDTLWPIWPTIERAEQALQSYLLGHAPVPAPCLPTRRPAWRCARR